MTELGVFRTGTRAVPVALWMGIMSALVIEAAALIVRTALGDFTTFGPYLADLSRVAMRATIVSGAIAIALLPMNGMMRPFVTAAAGVVFGPLACIAGRAVSGAVRARLGLPALSTDPTLLFVLGGVRSLEFGTLGFIVGLLATRRAPSASFGWAGLAVAVVFGVAVVAVKHESALRAVSASEMIANTIEELMFPIAIGLVLAAVTRIVEVRGVPKPLTVRQPGGLFRPDTVGA
jgi:hypothetical protein